jgi:hypothetical protein
MSTHSPAFVDAFRRLLNDLYLHLEKTESRATQYAECSVENSEAARDLISDLVLVIRGLPGEHELSGTGGCRICASVACPGCGATSSVQPQPAPPKVQAWTCMACGMEWAITCVNPHLRPTYLADLAERVDTLTDERLRDLLTTLAESCNR